MNAESIRRPTALLELAPVPIWIPATWGIGLDFLPTACDIGGSGYCNGHYQPPKKVSLELDDADRLLEAELLKLVDMEVLEMEHGMGFSTGGPSFELEDTCLELLGLPQDMSDLFEELEAGACQADSDSDEEDEEDEEEQGPRKRARADSC